MATIGTEPNGRKRILFVAGNGSRKTIRLGKATMKQAEAFKVKIEALVAGSITGNCDDEVSRWLAELPDALHTKLAAAGLVKSRKRSATDLESYLEDFFASLSVKPGTRVAYGHTRRYLINFFGGNRSLHDIEPVDADKWRRHLVASGLSDATVARRVGVARQIFRQAVKWKLIPDNPFADVRGGQQTNKSRMFFVPPDVARQVLDACPDTQWKLLFALSRYGGLRCPSEHLALQWDDIDWDKQRICVHSSKTEHHHGKDKRFIPLFPELRPLLMQAFDEAPPGSRYLITRYRSTNANLRTQFQRILKRAGVKPWPKLFHNLRSSRQTELAERYPIHVVCEWIGNSQAIAQDHYLQVTDAHFASAVVDNATDTDPVIVQST